MRTKISTARKELGMTQEKLAEKAQVTRQTIIALEQGKYNPSLQLAYRLKQILKKKDIEDLFELDKGL